MWETSVDNLLGASMLNFKCPQCHVALKVADDKAGQKGKCPKCHAPLVVPTQEPAQEVAPQPLETGPARAPAPAMDPYIVWKVMALALVAIFFVAIIQKSCSPPAVTTEESESVLELLPKEGAYGAPIGRGAPYQDPIHGFFQVQVPEGFQIYERRDKATVTTGPDSPRPGVVLQRSWVDFKHDKANICAIARRTLGGTIEEDIDFVKKEMRERFPEINFVRTRSVQIDGTNGAEVVSSCTGLHVILVRYKKHGLDHAIIITCPAGEFSRATYKEALVAFLRSYRSLEPAPAPPSGNS